MPSSLIKILPLGSSLALFLLAQVAASYQMLLLCIGFHYQFVSQKFPSHDCGNEPKLCKIDFPPFLFPIFNLPLSFLLVSRHKLWKK